MVQRDKDLVKEERTKRRMTDCETFSGLTEFPKTESRGRREDPIPSTFGFYGVSSKRDYRTEPSLPSLEEIRLRFS